MTMKQYKIFHGDVVFDASEYQCRIFDRIENGSGNLVINASAGSSKTTTIVNALRYVKDGKKVLFIAFNKDIVETIKSKVDRPFTYISTFHALGRSILVENGLIEKDSEPDEFKYKTLIKGYMSEHSDDLKHLSKKDYSVFMHNVEDLVFYSRYYLAMSVREIQKVCDLYGVVTVGDEVSVCREILLSGKNNLTSYDYTDMIWLCNVLNLTTKIHRYDWIFVDEIQDTSIMQEELITKCFKRGCRFVGVGDNEQKINVWCGSSTDAVDYFRNLPNTVEFELPITYRCAKKIVEVARQYSERIEACPDAPEGQVNVDVNKFTPNAGDMVLCRNTAPLVDLHLQYLKGNKKSYLRGANDIRDRYMSLINLTSSNFIDKGCITDSGLMPTLYNNLFKNICAVSAKYGLSEDEAIVHPVITQMYDDINGIKSLSDGLMTVDDLKSKIDIIFSGDADDAVQLSTIHKAKGLEADNVYIYCPSLLPSKWATKPWEVLAERNLCYVAYTRAKYTLNFIVEDKFTSRFTSKSIISKMKEEIEYAKRQQCVDTGVVLKSLDIKPKESPVIKLGDTQKVQPCDERRKKNGAQKFRNLLQ